MKKSIIQYISARTSSFLMIMEEEEGEGEPRGENETEENIYQLSLHSIEGFTSKRSLKLWGSIQNRRIVALIDCGATHNFIATMLVNELNLEVTSTSPYMVEVGDGHKVKCQGLCRDLWIEFQELKFTQNCYLFDLGGADLVLGVEWLASLGKVEANFEKLTLAVRVQGKKVVLKAEPTLIKAAISLKMVKGAMTEEDQGFRIELKEMEKQSREEVTPEPVLQVLDQFKEVFEQPQGLPPQRKKDHAINIHPGTKIPNLRPYGYPHY